jgi:drug/metabolite transporter (DMT)-like permease
MNTSFARGVWFGLIAVSLWGAQWPLAKTAFVALDTIAVNVARYSIAVVVLTPIFLTREGRAAFDYEGRFWRASIVGIAGMAASALLVFWGLSYTLPENAAVILALQPSLAALVDWWMRGRRPPAGTQVCIGLAFLGVILVVTKGEPHIALSPRELLGDLLILLGAGCWVGYTLAAARFRSWTSMRFTYLTMLPAAVFIIGFAAVAWLMGLLETPAPAAVWSVAPQLAYLALAGIVVAMLLWNAGNQRIGGLNAALLLNLMPVVTFTIRFLQGQRFTMIEVLGALLVVGALVANNLLARHDRSRADVPAPQAEP